MTGPFTQSWTDVSFVHFRTDPDKVSARLPKGLTLDIHDGFAWLSLVIFELEIRPLGGPAIPYLLRFPETNLRTYVRGPDGTPGIWFYSLDAPRLFGVIAGRLTYGLPYRWRESIQVRLEPGPMLGATADELDLFLTERYHLYHERGGRLLRTDVVHVPWPLRSARIVDCRQDLVSEPPVRAHVSPGVAASFAWPKPVPRRRLTLVIDGDCGVCRASARWAQRRATVDVEAAGPALSQVWLSEEDGNALGGAAAVNRLLSEMSLPWRALAALYRLAPVRWLEDRAYNWFAPRRGRLVGRFFPH